MKLICNADDFGLSRGVNYGILDAHNRGIVRSASLVPNGLAFDQAVEIAKAHKDLGVSVHLNLTFGRPVSGGHQSLVDTEGNCHTNQYFRQYPDHIDPAEVEREFRSQIDKVIEANILPSHLDTHHHIHELEPVLAVYLKLAREYGFPIRLRDRTVLTGEYAEIPCPDGVLEGFHGDTANVRDLEKLLDAHRHQEGIWELLCHPAYVDRILVSNSSYHMPRASELEVLTCREIDDYLRRNEMEYGSYRHYFDS